MSLLNHASESSSRDLVMVRKRRDRPLRERVRVSDHWGSRGGDRDRDRGKEGQDVRCMQRQDAVIVGLISPTCLFAVSRE